MNNNEPWYSVKTLLFHSAGGAYEERILLYKTLSFEDAEKKAITDTKAYVASLDDVSFIGIIDVFHLFDSAKSGSEVFSQIIRSKLSAETYIQKYYDLSPSNVIYTKDTQNQ